MDKNKALNIVLEATREIYGEDGSERTINVESDTPLVGSEAALDSMGLVQLCLSLEDKATDIGFNFDWTSDAAMSKSKGMYRSVDALADVFYSQYSNNKP
jgi:acyl carrier protein